MVSTMSAEDDDPGCHPGQCCSAEDAKRIAAEHLAAQAVARAMAHSRVEFGVGRFYGAPQELVWLVSTSLDAGNKVGGGRVIAVCPLTGRILGDGAGGE